ncbi:MAG: SBBP repeat-containing protein, partial [bacterium]|nr:SBBP repeat-containing protein [bacterium]
MKSKKSNMRRRAWILLGIVLLFGLGLGLRVSFASNAGGEVDEAARQKAIETYGKLPLYFIENRGQIDNQVKYYTRLPGQTLYFTQEEIVFDLYRQNTEYRTQRTKEESAIRNPQSVIERLSFSLKCLGANKEPRIEIEAEGKQEGKVNYFRGNDPVKWRSNIPIYREVFYRDIYPGIDLKLRGNGRQLEYEFIIQPGVEPEVIRCGFEGIEGLEVSREGELIITTAFGKLKDSKPYIYQEIDGQRVEVEGKFTIQNSEFGSSSQSEIEISAFRIPHSALYTYGFEVASYNPDYPLVIDPTLSYSTYLGGSNVDQGLGIAVDSSGAAYITGLTLSVDFPTSGPIPIDDTLGGTYDAFVTKITPGGDTLVYSTYLGGSGYEMGYGIAVDSSGAAYITGFTSSSAGFPTQSSIYGTFGGGTGDAFVTKINPAGNALVYSTYLGGGGTDDGRGIAVDSSGAAYITGYTKSGDFPTSGAIYDSLGGTSYDVFLTRITPAGDTLSYSTYLGGGKDDKGTAIAVDPSGAAYITGYTYSSDFPTSGPIYNCNCCDCSETADVFAIKITPAGDTLSYSTYLGGSGLEKGYGIAVDSSGATYITGETASDDFPTQNAIDSTLNIVKDAFVTKINSAGSALSYSTYLGGNANDVGWGIAVDFSGAAYITGQTRSTDFPLQDHIYSYSGGADDAFVTRIDPTGSLLSYSTYLGGTEYDKGAGIAVDSCGAAYITGETKSNAFPTKDHIDGSLSGASDAFVAKISPLSAKFAVDSTQDTECHTFNFNDNSSVNPCQPITWWDWDFDDDGDTDDSGQNVSHQYGADGTYTVRLTVTDNSGDTKDMATVIAVTPAKPTAKFAVDSASNT